MLHIGGGACALARALAAEDPTGLQEVCEFDADVLAIAREHLGLRRAPGLRVRHAEGREHLAAQRHDSWDAVVIDAFIGARVPARLMTADALADAARVAPLTLVNVVDTRSARDINAATAAMAAAYPSVWTLGRLPGNTIIGGCVTRHSPRPEAHRRARRRRPVTGPRRPTAEGRSSLGKVSVIRRARVPV